MHNCQPIASSRTTRISKAGLGKYQAGCIKGVEFTQNQTNKGLTQFQVRITPLYIERGSLLVGPANATFSAKACELERGLTSLASQALQTELENRHGRMWPSGILAKCRINLNSRGR